MKVDDSTIYIIIPVYNEAVNLPSLILDLKKLNDDLSKNYNLFIMIVDDGSKDNTSEILNQISTGLNLEVIRLAKNRGPGAAFAAGFSLLSNRLTCQDWVITMEGDNTSRCDLIYKMLSRVSEGYDVILASPFMYGGGFANTSLVRRILSSGANIIVKNLLGIQGILTVSSFFRLYKASAILKMQDIYGKQIIQMNGFESMLELVMKMIMLNFSISEIAMKVDTSRRKGKSKMKIIKTIVGYLSLLKQKNKWQLQAAKF